MAASVRALAAGVASVLALVLGAFAVMLLRRASQPVDGPGPLVVGVVALLGSVAFGALSVTILLRPQVPPALAYGLGVIGLSVLVLLGILTGLP